MYLQSINVYILVPETIKHLSYSWANGRNSDGGVIACDDFPSRRFDYILMVKGWSQLENKTSHKWAVCQDHDEVSWEGDLTILSSFIFRFEVLLRWRLKTVIGNPRVLVQFISSYPFVRGSSSITFTANTNAKVNSIFKFIFDSRVTFVKVKLTCPSEMTGKDSYLTTHNSLPYMTLYGRYVGRKAMRPCYRRTTISGKLFADIISNQDHKPRWLLIMRTKNLRCAHKFQLSATGEWRTDSNIPIVIWRWSIWILIRLKLEE